MSWIEPGGWARTAPAARRGSSVQRSGGRTRQMEAVRIRRLAFLSRGGPGPLRRGYSAANPFRARHLTSVRQDDVLEVIAQWCRSHW